MSDGREERKEQEDRRKWEEKKDSGDDRDREWERDGQRERRDSRAVELNVRLGRNRRGGRSPVRYIFRSNTVTNTSSVSG
jgi:hypothetical protein